MADKTRRSAPVIPTYKVGHVVNLRTGGPEMVIESIEPTGDLNCIWFGIRGDKWEPPYRDRFKAFTVQLAEYCDPDDPEAEYLPTEEGQPVASPGFLASLAKSGA